MQNLKSISLAILEVLAFNGQKFAGSRDPDHAHFRKLFFRGHVGNFPDSMPAIFWSYLHLTPKNYVVAWPWPRPLFKRFSSAHQDWPRGAWMPNLKSILSAIFELLAFNGQKFAGHVTMASPPFRKFFHVSYQDRPWEHACQIWSPYLEPFWSY